MFSELLCSVPIKRDCYICYICCIYHHLVWLISYRVVFSQCQSHPLTVAFAGLYRLVLPWFSLPWFSLLFFFRHLFFIRSSCLRRLSRSSSVPVFMMNCWVLTTAHLQDHKLLIMGNNHYRERDVTGHTLPVTVRTPGLVLLSVWMPVILRLAALMDRKRINRWNLLGERNVFNKSSRLFFPQELYWSLWAGFPQRNGLTSNNNTLKDQHRRRIWKDIREDKNKK